MPKFYCVNSLVWMFPVTNGVFYVQGIPESAEVAVPVGRFGSGQATETDASLPAPVSGAPNTAPLNMFPQVSF